MYLPKDINISAAKYLCDSDLKYMLDIINSDLGTKEKAKILYLFCPYERLKLNVEISEKRKPSSQIKLKTIFSFYKKYSELGYIPQEDYFGEELIPNLELLNKVYNILNSNINDYDKAAFFLQNFPSIKSFEEKYTPYVNLKNKDKRLAMAQDALNNFKELIHILKTLNAKGIFTNIRYYNNSLGYLINYDYAQFVLNSYINSPFSFNMNIFFEDLGINEDIFNFCVATVLELNISLYQKYLQKREENIKKDILVKQKNIKDLAQGIKTGYLEDGTPLTILEFFKRLPFVESKLYSHLLDFIRKYSPEDEEIIKDYINKNNLLNSVMDKITVINKPFIEIDMASLYNVKSYVDGKEIFKDDIDCIIAYLKIKQIPLVTKAFNFAKKEYIEGKFNWDTIEEMQSDLPIKKTLIPTNLKK